MVIPAWPRGMGAGADAAEATGADWSVAQPLSTVEIRRSVVGRAGLEKLNENGIHQLTLQFKQAEFTSPTAAGNLNMQEERMQYLGDLCDGIYLRLRVLPPE